VTIGQRAAGGADQFRSPNRISVEIPNEIGLQVISLVDPGRERVAARDHFRRPLAEERFEVFHFFRADEETTARVGVVTRATMGVPISPTPPPNPPLEIPTRRIAGITTA